MRLVTLASVLALGLAAPAFAQDKPADQAAPTTYDAPIVNNKGETIGKIALRDGANTLVMRVAIQAGGLPPGWHGIHFHAVGSCADTDKFQESKAHVNHDNAKHGLLNAEGPDEGDLPNVYANADGSVNAEVSSDTPLTGEGGLKDNDGSALIIHANEDDHSTQPIGNAGARIACAVIK
ncbi:superoxide dismutase family protein [Methylobacterium sp. Gmos1]